MEVYTFQAAKPAKIGRRYDSTSDNNTQEQQDSSNLVQIEGQDYNTDLPIIEGPSRAVILEKLSNWTCNFTGKKFYRFARHSYGY